MTEHIHIYCDESCHLENDHMRSMVLGALWCPATHRRELAGKIKALKVAFDLPANFEIKWVKVSPGKLPFYQALLDLFFDEPLLHFRGLVVTVFPTWIVALGCAGSPGASRMLSR